MRAVALAVFFIALGGVLLCLEYENLHKAQASESWIKTEGTILRVDYERTSQGRPISNSPIVTYRYTIDGHSYVSSVRSFGDDMDAKDIFRKYKIDEYVVVFYDPTNASNATLVPGVGMWTIVGLQFAWLIFVFGVAYLLVVCIRIGLKRRFPNKAAQNDSQGGRVSEQPGDLNSKQL